MSAIKIAEISILLAIIALSGYFGWHERSIRCVASNNAKDLTQSTQTIKVVHDTKVIYQKVDALPGGDAGRELLKTWKRSEQ